MIKQYNFERCLERIALVFTRFHDEFLKVSINSIAQVTMGRKIPHPVCQCFPSRWFKSVEICAFAQHLEELKMLHITQKLATVRRKRMLKTKIQSYTYFDLHYMISDLYYFHRKLLNGFLQIFMPSFSGINIS